MDFSTAVAAPGLPNNHLSRLAFINEDTLDEEIGVLCELEPGALVFEQVGLTNPSAGNTVERIAKRWATRYRVVLEVSPTNQGEER